jgi:hypothetical protein
MAKEGGQMTIPLLAVMMFVNLAAVDMTGTWTFNMNDFSGHPRTFDCTFKQEATKLTGVCGAEEPRPVKITGTVKGRKVAFQHQTGKKNEMTAHYSGDLNEAATSLKGKWRVVNPDDGRMMSDDFTAVKR